MATGNGTQQLNLGAIIAAPLSAVIEADAQGVYTFIQFLKQVAFTPDESPDPPSPSDALINTEKYSAAEVRLAKEEHAEALRKYRYQKTVATTLDDMGTNVGQLNYVSFSYEHTVDGEKITSVVRVPLLSLLPMPLLQVQEATFDFDVNVLCIENTDVTTEDPEKAAKADVGGASDTDAVAALPGQRLVNMLKTEKTLLPPRMIASLAPGKPSVKEDTDTVNSSYNPTGKVQVHIKMQSADLPAGLSNLLNLVSYGTETKTISDTSGDDS